MIFPTNETWDKWGIIEDHHKFFILRWEEIFSEETYDSWQVRTVNFISVLTEMIDAVAATAAFHSFHRNIRLLIDEARQLAKTDPIIHEYFPHINDYLDKLEQCYEDRIKNEKKNALSEYKRLLSVIIEQTNSYLKLLKERLIVIISGPPVANNNEFIKLIMALGVALNSRGYSIAFLRDSFRILIDNSIPNFKDRFENFLSVFSSEELGFV